MVAETGMCALTGQKWPKHKTFPYARAYSVPFLQGIKRTRAQEQEDIFYPFACTHANVEALFTVK